MDCSSSIVLYHQQELRYRYSLNRRPFAHLSRRLQCTYIFVNFVGIKLIPCLPQGFWSRQTCPTVGFLRAGWMTTRILRLFWAGVHRSLDRPRVVWLDGNILSCSMLYPCALKSSFHLHPCHHTGCRNSTYVCASAPCMAENLSSTSFEIRSCRVFVICFR